MDRQKLDPKQVDQLLDAVGKKLGVAPQQLKTELESGKYDNILRNMSQKDSAMLQKVLQNPKMMEKTNTMAKIFAIARVPVDSLK